MAWRIPSIRRKVSACAAVLGVLGLAACGTSPSSSASGKHLEPLRFQWGVSTASPETVNVLIAQYLGYFREEGLDVSFGFSGGGNLAQAVELLRANKAQAAIMEPSTLLYAAAQGTPFGVPLVCNMVPTGISELIVPKDSSVHSIADLRGKRIGVGSAGDPVTHTIEAAFAGAGLPADSAKLTALGLGETQIQALQRGLVDAVATYNTQPLAILANQGQFRSLALPDEQKMIGAGIAVSPTWMSSHRSEVAGLVRGAMKGFAFAQANPEAAIRIMWRMYPASKPAGMSDAQAMAVDLARLKVRLHDMAHTGGNPYCTFTNDEWQTTARLLQVDGKIHDFAPFYTNDFTKDANDFDSNAITQQAKNYQMG